MLSWDHPERDPRQPWATVVAGAPLHPSPRVVAAVRGAALLVAADSGAESLAALEAQPDLVVGDFDSIHPDALLRLRQAGIEVIRFDPHKDKTDSQLALDETARRGYSRIVLLGWLAGGRWDHALANQLLLAAPAYAPLSLTILDGKVAAYVVRSELRLAGTPGDIVSVLPVAGDASGVTLDGFAYPLARGRLQQASTLGVSNQLQASQGRIRVESGVLLVYHYPAGLEQGAG